ncbi:hypothetical protein A2U01_0008300 [Trifolium medium]|uniref:Uncharacterized protein n=1 Tax=Trifolium medium TaxID=97028 RepID=A0A392MIU3_9FABA|nr:hypothetical protein [Trifolium medium]
MIECNIAVPVTFSQYTVMIFDPSGLITPLSVTLLYGAIALIPFSPSTFCLIMVFVVEFSDEFAVIVFDPGGNRHHSQLKSLTAIFTSEAKHTKLQTFASIICYWILL